MRACAAPTDAGAKTTVSPYQKGMLAGTPFQAGLQLNCNTSDSGVDATYLVERRDDAFPQNETVIALRETAPEV